LRLFDFLRRPLLVERLRRHFSLLFLSILTLTHKNLFLASISVAASVVDMKSPVALPIVAGVVQMSICRDSYGNAGGLLAAKGSFTFPAASGARQERTASTIPAVGRVFVDINEISFQFIYCSWQTRPQYVASAKRSPCGDEHSPPLTFSATAISVSCTQQWRSAAGV
jgi:hypothetical protein